MTLPRTVMDYVVAFSAARTIQMEHEGPASIFFNRVSFNMGNDFNAGKGVFTCQVPGAYLFAVSAGANITGGRSSCR